MKSKPPFHTSIPALAIIALLGSHHAKAKQLFEELKTWQKETKAVIPTVLNETFDSSGATSQKGK